MKTKEEMLAIWADQEKYPDFLPILKEFLEDVETLKEKEFELGENLKAAENQNHYFTLMGEWRDKWYEAERKLKIMAHWINDTVESELGIDECRGDCAFIEAREILGIPMPVYSWEKEDERS